MSAKVIDKGIEIEMDMMNKGGKGMAPDKLKESLKKYPWFVEPKPPSEMTDEDIARLRFCDLSEQEGVGEVIC